MLTMSDDHTIAHELGHNFGLGHSDILRDGVEETYYGVHSVQGIAMFYDESYTTTYATPSLDVAYEWLFETVPTSAVTTGTANGTTTLSAVTASSGTKGLAFFDTKKRMYFVEYRDGSGTDASTFYNQYGYGGWQRLDSSPGWDDTAVTASLLAVTAATATLVAGRFPWLFAVTTGMFVPLFELGEIAGWGPLAAFLFSGAGSAAGWIATRLGWRRHRTVDPLRDGAFRLILEGKHEMVELVLDPVPTAD